MKVFSNFPELEEDIIELENRVADFHATLVIERIKQLNINDKTKEKLLQMILEDLKEKCMIE